MKKTFIEDRIRLPIIGFGIAEVIIMPFSLVLGRENGQVLTRVQNFRFQDGRSKWHFTNRIGQINQVENGCHLVLNSETSSVQFELSLVQEQGSLLVSYAANDIPGIQAVGLDLSARRDEHFLGLGERFDHLDQRGHQVNLYVQNSTTHSEVYKPIPFYCSSAGYGLQILTDVLCQIQLCIQEKPEIVSIQNNQASVGLRFIFGDNPKEIISRYTDYCGRLPLPPRWIFGPWKSRDWETDNQFNLLEELSMERKLNLPSSVKLIDAAWEPYYHSFEFDRDRFPDPHALIQEIHNSGNKVILWISPWLSHHEPATSVFQECEEKGFLIRNPQGQTHLHRLANDPCMVGTCFDFTNPQMVAWWKSKLRKLLQMGVDGFKTDFGEQVPDDAVFFDGRTGYEIHNIYPRIYNQVTWEAMQEEGIDGVLLARSAWDGSQKYSAIWAGDQTSDFSPATGLKSVILAGQSAGISGFPYWASDIGGYYGVPTDEVFIRWIQFGAFSPIMLIHGVGMREPWKFSSQTLEIYKKYAQLHMDLFPYIYSYAKISSETGIPIMRALALEFPEDPQVWNEIAEHQYFFGEELLVAPVYYGFNHIRFVYLPDGTWRDFWTGKQYQGSKTHLFDAELEDIPVLVKAGSIIPLLHPSASSRLPNSYPERSTAGDNLRLHLYPGADGHFHLYDGTIISWNENNQELEIKNSPVKRQVAVRLFYPERNHKAQILHPDQETGDKSILEEGSGYTLISIPPKESSIIYFK